MDDGTAIKVIGSGTVNLKFTSRKILTIWNMQLIPAIKRNLLSGSLFVQLGFEIVLESNKIIISKEDINIGKSFVSKGCSS